MHQSLQLTGELRGLRDPIVIGSFFGWSDGSGTAMAAMRYVRSEWGAMEVANVDPDRFYDLTVARQEARDRIWLVVVEGGDGGEVVREGEQHTGNRADHGDRREQCHQASLGSQPTGDGWGTFGRRSTAGRNALHVQQCKGDTERTGRLNVDCMLLIFDNMTWLTFKGRDVDARASRTRFT